MRRSINPLTGGHMKSFVLIVLGLLILFTPGGLTVLIIWSLIFPRHKTVLLNFIIKTKRRISMEFERKAVKIKGMSESNDKQYAQKVDLSDLEKERVEGVDKAFKYLEMRYDGSRGAAGPALVVTAFAIGAGLIGTLWVISNLNILPF
jgi:UPF0716 family protein affecting phage T7 exclusion